MVSHIMMAQYSTATERFNQPDRTYANVLTRRGHEDRTLKPPILALPKATTVRKLGPRGFFNRYGVVALLLLLLLRV